MEGCSNCPIATYMSDAFHNNTACTNCSGKTNNRVFPKWMSLNSANHDKIQNSIVTANISYLDIITFSVIVVESTFSSLPLGRYLLPVTTLNRYLSRHSSKFFIFTTLSESITIIICWVFLVTVPVLYFVTIHWIQRKSFKKNSNNYLYKSQHYFIHF